MNDVLGHRTETDARLVKVLDSYLAAVQAGAAPGKAELLAGHPDLADDLEECLASLEFIRQAAVSPVPVEPSDSSPALEPTRWTLGDFRIVREVGRGGMGVVYEAEQISLGRRVALKVLPFAAALDAKQLQRFKNEAQAAAHLHHTNIVPVYAVGAERGVHFYAMQYIEGRTLATVIREMQQAESGAPEPRSVPLGASLPTDGAAAPACPTLPIAALSTERTTKSSAFFRQVARFGVQAAEGLEYAHAQGIVHRDIKPANLLLDDKGQIWITDFGLAHCQSEAGLTMSGDLIGTLRYMSPEQALGRRGQIDHRTDIYSLGATLYELLTGRPAQEGSERHVLLRQIAEREPLRPRQGNTAIPVDLETIVVKALAKEPDERYTAAQELAEDLGRFLRDEPIKAKRPSALQRAKKWARRHRGMVAAGITFLLITAVGLAVSTVLIWQAKNEAERALGVAEANYREARTQSVIADTQRQRAEKRFEQAQEAVDQLLTEVGQNMLAQTPQMEQVRRRLLEKALAFNQAFLEERGDDPSLRYQAGLAYVRRGDIYGMLSQLAAAEESYRAAIGLFGGLAAEAPANPDYARGLAQSHNNLGAALERAGRPQEALRAYFQGLEHWQRLSAVSPDVPGYQLQTLQSHYNLGALFKTTERFDKSEEHLLQALNLGRSLLRALLGKESCRGLFAMTHYHLGDLRWRTHRNREAEELFREALDIQGKLLADQPGTPEHRRDYARIVYGLARLLAEEDRFDDAERYYHRALETQEELVKDFPTVPEHRRHLARSRHRLAELLCKRGRWEQAKQTYDETLKTREKLAADFPSVPSFRADYADTLNALASFLIVCPEAKFRDERRALEIAKKAVDLAPERAGYWGTLSMAHYRNGDWKAGLAATQKSLELSGR